MTNPFKQTATLAQRAAEISPDTLIEIAQHYNPGRSFSEPREHAKQAIRWAAWLIIEAEDFHKEYLARTS